jgi:uncharacterized delta-60 repeat protein
MNYAKVIVCLSITLVIAFLTSCGGHQTNLTNRSSVNSAIAELDAMATPKGADPAVFASLKDALREALIVRGTGKLVATPPTGTANSIPDLVVTDNGDGTYNFAWHYYNIGDYNQDGIVGVSDITPLAMHFGQTWDNAVPGDVNTLPAVADGSNNEKVDIADVTPIAMNFGVEIANYRLDTSPNGIDSWGEVNVIPLSEGLDKETARMRFSVDLPAYAGIWYHLVPRDGEGNSGQPSVAFQAPATVTVWGHTWGNTLDDKANAVATDADGNTYVAGSYSAGALNTDALLVKYGADGSLLWQKTWGGAQDDISYGITGDGAGNVYVTGETENFGVQAQVFILKYTPAGVLLWQKVWGSVWYASGRAITLNSAGSVYVTGYSAGMGTGYESLILLKYEGDGTYVGEVGLSTTNDINGFSLAVDNSDNVFIAGMTQDTPTGYEDMFVVKYSPDGTMLWQKSWGGDLTDTAYGVSTDASGNAYVAGQTWDYGQGSTDVVLLKFDTDGALLWQETWGGPDHDEAYAITADGSGNLYVTGDTISFGAGMFDGFLLKFSPDGASLWARTWGAPLRDDSFQAVAMSPDGTVNLAGWDQMPDGVWGDASAGVTAFQAVPIVDGTGVVSTPAGVDSTPVGIESVPAGVQDTGGGGNDILIVRTDTTSW